MFGDHTHTNNQDFFYIQHTLSLVMSIPEQLFCDVAFSSLKQVRSIISSYITS